MILRDLYEPPKLWHVPFLLLEERELQQNISHRAMPSWDEHCAFVESRPYLAWYVIQSDFGHNAGAVYLSKQREIGVGVLRDYRGAKYGGKAIEALMLLHPGRFLANVAPGNDASHRLFEALGFTPLQVTYALE